MTPRFLPCCLSIVLLASVQGCIGILVDRETIRGSGNVSEEIFVLTGITGVQLATMGELEIQLGNKDELRIEADDNLLRYFEAVEDGDTLRIGTIDGTWRRFSLRPSRPVRHTLTVKELEFIGLSSAGDAHAQHLSADRLEIRVTSAGDLTVDDLRANALEVVVSSAGDVRIDDGVVDRQDLRISSAGDYHAESVRSAHVTVRLSSVGTHGCGWRNRSTPR